MFDEKGRFIIENFNRQTTFSSFLPGISGLHGIPIWSFYVNRGQAITSFGTENKNHSIMEFYPAHQAYQLTKKIGFRTFLKIDGEYYEPFQKNDAKTKMYIGMNELEIEEINEKYGIKINVLYYTLPNENLGGLVRTVTICNCSPKEKKIEMLDGMPAIIPYGIELSDLKEMAQTMKAWMQVEDLELNVPYYRVRYSTKDSAIVSKVEEGNYMLAVDQEGHSLPILGDPELIFEYDTAFEVPIGFLNTTLTELQEKRQITQNQVPSGFVSYQTILGSEKKTVLHSVIGQVKNKKLLKEFSRRVQEPNYFIKKYGEAVELTEKISEVIETKTANPVFDKYCRQTYIDNVLRGGYPVRLGEYQVFYAYSRKHGDIERDYNFFHMLPEYFSQGNGNFRDVNQNRRSDVLFTPYVKRHNIAMFYNLIQLDGYNPLSVNQTTYQVESLSFLKKIVEQTGYEALQAFFINEFSPGTLLQFMESNNISIKISEEKFLIEVMNHAKENTNADFLEGYWTDHWTYNLDLIESFLAVYPEEERALLFEDDSYTYYESRAVVRPRDERYIKTPMGIRQYHAVDEKLKEENVHTQVHTSYGKGEIYQSNLFTKLIILAINKFATLDMYGMGIEMEGGKPGWYDALNGLPGIFGSSMSETYELQRLLHFMKRQLANYQYDMLLPIEGAEFIWQMKKVMQIYQKERKDRLWVWNELNLSKEAYRQKTIYGIDGALSHISYKELLEIIDGFIDYIEQGIEKAYEQCKEGVVPTYFAYYFENYEIKNRHIIPQKLKLVSMPLFLEGPVHMLKLPYDSYKKYNLYQKVRASGLYDTKLKMYKVNESLAETSFEVGRAKAFSPGWLENESIWLHMEYKYLLELLKSGMYKEFFEDFRNACIPFMNYKTYGRSLLENSSFIASSANQNEKIQGKGFVARLSGSTAEFLQIWQIMMFGKNPFKDVNGKLQCSFEPTLPRYLIPEDLVVEAMLLGTTKVIYHFDKQSDVVASKYKITGMKIQDVTGKEIHVSEGVFDTLIAKDIRNGNVKEINVFIAN